MRFIELHDRDGNPILINVHHILTIAKCSGDVTDIVMVDGLVIVAETPDEILIKIRG
jgi:uncharacterized protein YlzI (FlbEa/FlbD family)